MIDNDEIEVEVMSEEDLDIEAESKAEKSKKSGLGVLPVLALTSIAAILGAVGGAFGTQYVTPQNDFSSEFANMKASLTQSISTAEQKAEKDIATLQNKIKELERKVQITANDETLSSAVEGLSLKVESLEKTIPSEIAAIDSETLISLNKAQADGFVWPDNSEQSAEIETLKNNVAELRAALGVLESQGITVEAQTLEAYDTPIASPESTVNFPKDALLALAEAQAEPKNFISRALSKHISVQDPSNPSVLIRTAAKAAAAGNYSEAAKTFDKLPADIRTAGKTWRDTVAN